MEPLYFLFSHGSLDEFKPELQIVKQPFPFIGKRISDLPVKTMFECLKKFCFLLKAASLRHIDN